MQFIGQQDLDKNRKEVQISVIIQLVQFHQI